MAETFTPEGPATTSTEWDGSWSGLINDPEWDTLTPDQQKKGFRAYKDDFISRAGSDLASLDVAQYRKWVNEMDDVEAGFAKLDQLAGEEGKSAQQVYAERKDLIAGGTYELSFGGDKMLDDEGNIVKGYGDSSGDERRRYHALEDLNFIKNFNRSNDLIRRGISPGQHLGIEAKRWESNITLGGRKFPKVFPENAQGLKFYRNELSKLRSLSEDEQTQSPYVFSDLNEPLARVTPSEDQRAWLKDPDGDGIRTLDNGTQPYYWETYRHEGKLLFNPGQVLRGAENYFKLVKDNYSEEDAEQSVKAATDFAVNWAHLQRRLTNYLGSKTYSTQQTSFTEFDSYTFPARFHESGGDPEIGENAPGFDLFLHPDRLEEYREEGGLLDPNFGADKLKSLREFFLPKIGMQEKPGEQLVSDEDLRLLYWHAVADIEDAWDEKVLGADDPRGNFMINPKAIRSWDLDKIASGLEAYRDPDGLGLSEESKEQLLETAWQFQEDQASSVMSAMLLGARPTPKYTGKTSRLSPGEDKWDYSRVQELSAGQDVATKMRDTNSSLLRVFLKEYHENVKAGTREPRTDRELLEEFKKGIQDPSSVKEMSTLKNVYFGGRLVSISSLGMFLQTLKSADQNKWSNEPIGKLAQNVGQFLVGFEDGVLKGIPDFLYGVAGAVQSIGSDSDPDLIRAVQHLSRLGAEVDASNLYTGAKKWGGIFGREAIFLATAAPTAGWSLAARGVTMGASRLTNVAVRKGISKVAPGLAKQLTSMAISNELKASSLRAGVAIAGESTVPLAATHWFLRKGGVKSVDQFGRTLLERFATAGAKGTYYTMQMGRSGEAMYREAYNANREKFLLEGYTPEEASNRAVSSSWGPALAAGLVTGALMRLIPGGTERIFEKGLGQMTFKEMLTKAGIKKRDLTKALGAQEFKEAGKLFLQGTMAGKGYLIHGGAEFIEEFLDETMQGFISAATWNPDMTLDQIFSAAAEAGVVGLFMGSAVSGGMQLQGVGPQSRYHVGEDGKVYWQGKPENKGDVPPMEVLPEEYQVAWDNVRSMADKLRATGNTETTVALDEVSQAFDDRKESSLIRVESVDRDAPRPQNDNEVWWLENGDTKVRGRFLEVTDPVTGDTGEFVKAEPTEENPDPQPIVATDVMGLTTREADLDVPAADDAAMEVFASLRREFQAAQGEGVRDSSLSQEERKEKLREIYDRGREKLSNNAAALGMWDSFRGNYDRTAESGMKLGTPVGASPSRAVQTWASQPESNVEDGFRTRGEFLGAFNQAYTGQSVKGYEELFRQAPESGGVAITALDIAFGSIHLMEKVMGASVPRVEPGELMSPEAEKLSKKAKNVRDTIGRAVSKFNTAMDQSLADKNLTGAAAIAQTESVQRAIGSFYNSIAGILGKFGLNKEPNKGDFVSAYQTYLEENPLEVSTDPILGRLDIFVTKATRNVDGLLNDAFVALPKIDWAAKRDDTEGKRYIHNVVRRKGLPWGQYQSDVRISMDSPTALWAQESLRQLQGRLDEGEEGIASVDLYSTQEEKRVTVVSRAAFKSDLKTRVQEAAKNSAVSRIVLPGEELQDNVYNTFLLERALVDEDPFDEAGDTGSAPSGTSQEVVPITADNLDVSSQLFTDNAFLEETVPTFREYHEELIKDEPAEQLAPYVLYNAWEKATLASLDKAIKETENRAEKEREGLSGDSPELEIIDATMEDELAAWQQFKDWVQGLNRDQQIQEAGLKVAPAPSAGAAPDPTPAPTAEELDAAAKKAQEEAEAAAEAAEKAQKEAAATQITEEDTKKAEDRRSKAQQAYAKAQEDLERAEENQEYTSEAQFEELEKAVETASTELTEADKAWSDSLAKSRKTRKTAQGAAQAAEQAQQKAQGAAQAAEKGPEVKPTVQSDTKETKETLEREFRKQAIDEAAPENASEEVYEFQVEDEETGDLEEVTFDSPAAIVRDVADTVYYDPAFANKDEVAKLNEFEVRFRAAEDNAGETLGEMQEADEFFAELDTVKDLIRGISTVEELTRFNKDISVADTIMAEQQAEAPDLNQDSADKGSNEPKVDPDLKKAGTKEEDRYAKGKEIKDFLDKLRKVRVVKNGPEAGVPVDSVTLTKEGLTDSNDKLVIRDVRVKHEKDGITAINNEIFELFPLDLDNVKQFNKLSAPISGIRSKLGAAHVVEEEGGNLVIYKSLDASQRKAGKNPAEASPSFVGSKYALAIRKDGGLGFAFTNSPMHVAAQLTQEYYAAKSDRRDYEGFQLPKKYEDNPKLLNPAIKVENGMVVGATVPFRVGINSGKLEEVYVGTKKAVRTLADINGITVSEAARNHSVRNRSVPKNREFNAVLVDIETLGDKHELSESELEFITSGDTALMGLDLYSILGEQLNKFSGVTALPAEARTQILGGLASRVYLSILKTRLANLSPDITGLGMETGESEAVVLDVEKLRNAFDVLYKPKDSGFTAVGGMGKHLWELVAVRMTNGRGVEELFADTEKFSKEEDKHKRKYHYISDETPIGSFFIAQEVQAYANNSGKTVGSFTPQEADSLDVVPEAVRDTLVSKGKAIEENQYESPDITTESVMVEAEDESQDAATLAEQGLEEAQDEGYDQLEDTSRSVPTTATTAPSDAESFRDRMLWGMSERKALRDKTKSPVLYKQDLKQARESRRRIVEDLETLGIPAKGTWTLEIARGALEIIARGGHATVKARRDVPMDSTSINARREMEMTIAQQLLDSFDRMDWDTVAFNTSDIAADAGRYTGSVVPGLPHTLTLSNRVTNAYGVANALLHEMRHHVINHTIDNPTTPAEIEFVESLTLMLHRLRTYYTSLVSSRTKALEKSARHATTVATYASPRRIRKALVRSNSIHAAGFDEKWARTADLRYTDESEWVTNDAGEVLPESKETPELIVARSKYLQMLREKFGVLGDNDALQEVGYVLGMGDHEGTQSETYHLKELAVAIQNSPFFRDFVKDVDADLAGGSIFTKFMRSAWYSRTGSPPDSASVILEGMINDIHEDSLSIDPSRFGVLVSKLGSPKVEQALVDEYRKNNPAVSASLPRANAEYVKTAIPAKWDHPTMGIKSRPRLGAAAWLLPNGRMLPANPDKNEWHETIVRKAFPQAPQWTDEGGIPINTAEALALKSGWVRVTIERDSVAGTTLWYAASTPLGGLSSKQRSIIKDWAAMQDVDLANVKYDAEPLKEALADLAAAKRAGRLDSSASLPAHRFESRQEAQMWESYQKSQASFKKLREAFLRMGVTIVPDDVETPQVSYTVNDVVLVPKESTPELADLTREGLRSSFKSLFTTADRKFALYETGQISPEVKSEISSILQDAGSYENLMANIVTQAALGDASPTKLGPVDLQTFGNQILAGAYGEGARFQLQTLMDVADNSLGLKFEEIAVTNNLPNWDTNHNGIRELGLSILPETIPDLKRIASEQDLTVTELLDELDVDSDFKEQVEASLAFQEQRASSYEGVGAAHQLSITRKDRASRSPARSLTDFIVGNAVVDREKVNANYLLSKLGLSKSEIEKLKLEVDKWAYDDIVGVQSAAVIRRQYLDEGFEESEADALVAPLTDKIKKFPNKQLSDAADYNISLVLRDPYLTEVSDVSTLKRYIKTNYGDRAWGPVVTKLIEAVESNTSKDDDPLGLQWESESDASFYNLRDNSLNLNLAASPRTAIHELTHAGTSRWVFSHEYRIQQKLEEMGLGDNAYGDVLDTLLEDKKTPALMKDVVRVYRSAVEQAGLAGNLKAGQVMEGVTGLSPRMDKLFTDAQLGRNFPSVFGNPYAPARSSSEQKFVAEARTFTQGVWGEEQRKFIADELGVPSTHPQLDYEATRRVYGFTNMGEFLSESWASDAFAERLAGMTPVERLESTPTEEATNLLQQLQGLIRKLFKSLGLDLSKKSNKTLLDQVQSLTAQIMTREDHVNLDYLISENPVKLSQRTEEGYSAVESTEFDQSLRDPRLDKPESAAVKKLRESIDKGPETSRSLPASGLTPYANTFNTPRLASNTSYAWRSMGTREFKKLIAGEKEYSGDKAATKGNWLAGAPESASQYAAEGKILVEFGGVSIRGEEGLSPGSVAGVGNITNVWVYDERKEDWVHEPNLNPSAGALRQEPILDLSTVQKTREYLRSKGFFDTSTQRKILFPLGLVKRLTEAFNTGEPLSDLNRGEKNLQAAQSALVDFGSDLAKAAEKTKWTKTEVAQLLKPFTETTLGVETSRSIPSTLTSIKEKFIRTRKRDLGTKEVVTRSGAQQDALGVATYVRNPSSALLAGIAGGIVGLTAGHPVAGSVIGATLGKFIPDKYLFPEARKTYIPPMIRALRDTPANLERLAAMMTVEGKMGPVGQRILTELRGEIYKNALLAASHMKEIRFRMQRNSSIQTEFIEDLENPDFEYYNPDLAEAINYMLGTANDEDVLDLMFPASVAGGPSKRQEYEQIKREGLMLISSQQTKAMNTAKRLVEEGADQPEAQRWYRDEIASIAKQREGVLRVFHDGMKQLYKDAGKLFKVRQEKAGTFVKAVDKKLYEALRDSRNTLNELQLELTQYPEMLQSYTGADLEFLQNLTSKLGSTVGSWLTRSYDSLDRKGWVEFLEHSDSDKAKKAWEAGYNFFENELLSFEVERLMQQSPEMPAVTAKILVERYNKPTKADIETRMKEWLAGWQKERTTGIRTGLMNLKALQPRADVPKELRELVGQHKDNIFNMSRSIVTLGSMLANHKFLISIKDTLESAEKVSRDKVKADGKGTPLVLLTQDKRIAADNGLVPFVDENERIRLGGEHYGPLAKHYGPRHLVEALRDIQPNQLGNTHQVLGHLASWTMGNMTTRRLRTHVRNFIGNPIFLMNAGMPVRAFAHLAGMPISAMRQAFGPNYVVPPGSPSSAFAMAGNNKVVRTVSGKLRQWSRYSDNKDSGATTFGEESRRFMGEHARLGLTGSDVHVSHQKELRASLKDPTIGMRETWGDIPQGAIRLLDNANTWLTEMYQAGDDYWKISAYEGQLEKLARAFGLLEELPVVGRYSNLVGSPVKLRNQIEEKVAGVFRLKGDSKAVKQIIDQYGDKATPEVKALQKKYGDRAFALELMKRAAARNVHITMPNYGNALEGIRLMKKYGVTSLIAPFISFTGEVYRIRIQTPMLAVEEMRSKVPGIRAMGAARMMHTVANYTLSRYALKGAASLMVRLANFLDEEDEEKILPGQGEAGFTHEAALKRILGKFYKDGVVAVLGKDGNDITWVDLTYMYSFSQFDNATQLMIPQKVHEGIGAMINSVLPSSVVNDLGLADVGSPSSESDMKRFNRGLGSLAVPFISGQLYIDAVQKAQERQMDSLLELDQTSVPTMIGSVAESYLGILLPGTITDLKKVWDAAAAGGETYENGRRVTPWQELFAQISGTKINTTDIDWAYTKLYNYRAKQRMDAELSFTKLLKGRSTVDPKLYRERFEYMQTILGQLAKELHYDYMGARQLMGNTQARLHLEGHKSLSSELKEQARLGEYTPWIPSRRDLEVMDEESLVIGRSESRRALTEELIGEMLLRGHTPIEGGSLDTDDLDMEAALQRLKMMR